MLKLIQLEWRKNNIGKYIRNAMILAGVLCLFLFALAYLGIANDRIQGFRTQRRETVQFQHLLNYFAVCHF